MARVGATVFSLLSSIAQPVAAHPSRGDYIQHHTLLRVDPVNIDVEIEIGFDDMRAMAERHRMDRDHDWRISGEELRSYAETLTEATFDQLTLNLDGRPLELIPLHEAEVDLAGQSQVAPRSCTLRLFFFARCGPALSAGSRLALVDRLWESAPALCTLRAEGTRGVSVQVTQAGDVFPAAGAGRPRELSAVCLKTPPWKPENIHVATRASETTGPRWYGLLTAMALSGVALIGSRRKPGTCRSNSWNPLRDAS